MSVPTMSIETERGRTRLIIRCDYKDKHLIRMASLGHLLGGVKTKLTSSCGPGDRADTGVYPRNKDRPERNRLV